MIPLYASLLATANRLIKEKGAAATHYIRTPPSYDPATGSAAPAITTQACFCVLTGGSVRNKGNTSVTISSPQEMYVDAGSIVTPFKIGDEILFSSVRYTVVTVDSISPDGNVLVWILGVSAGQ